MMSISDTFKIFIGLGIPILMLFSVIIVPRFVRSKSSLENKGKNTIFSLQTIFLINGFISLIGMMSLGVYAGLYFITALFPLLIPFLALYFGWLSFLLVFLFTPPYFVCAAMSFGGAISLSGIISNLILFATIYLLAVMKIETHFQKKK